MKATSLLIALLLVVACAPKDPTAWARDEYPGASQYLFWQRYLLIRYPQDSDRQAVLLKLEQKEWRELARSSDGFRRGREVITWIPELDEDGVEALDLK
ncbi:MAG TPA: hypothetical protein ENN51_04980 [candidate division WOR-3 bacterium]|uniref:Uncharacterized protein n=1 Tax=candidate division WOR-3 bacterium TaxID=2052148 RepID=A0A7V0XF09_UNCW3|nr:hypothetical protein [candidate division WOR-3 bacterium]